MPIAQVLGEAYRETAGHEYAHILTWWLIQNKPSHYLLDGDLRHGHGRGWKNVMRFLELEPERCASHESVNMAAEAGAMGVTYVYGCNNGHPVYHFSQRRHNAVVRDHNRYLCKHCRGLLTFKGV